MAKITNTSPGQRSIWSAKDGMVTIDAGDTADVNLTAADLADAKATGWFDVEGKGVAAKPAAKKPDGVKIDVFDEE